MKIAGIIAEYNPFHTGHAYHIAQTRALSGADAVAVMMSGNFVQRGGPAVADKWTRARAAVAGGADVVFELPTCFAHAPAQVFATGAIKSMEQSGCIDVLSFGAEDARVSDYAKLVLEKENEIEAAIQKMHTPQASYPALYADAVAQVCGVPASFLSRPNNMLALEYMKALFKLKSKIAPLAIERVGAGYHDAEQKDGYVSATAMRQMATDGEDAWQAYMPEGTLHIYKEAMEKQCFPVTTSAFDTALLSYLRRMPASCFSEICDMPAGFENRIVQMAREATSIEALIALCGAKQYTTARVRRLIWNCFLGMAQSAAYTEPQYLRVLAFNENGRRIIKRMKETSALPLILKTADAQENAMLALDIFATDLYYASSENTEKRKSGMDFIVSPTEVRM